MFADIKKFWFLIISLWVNTDKSRLRAHPACGHVKAYKRSFPIRLGVVCLYLRGKDEPQLTPVPLSLSAFWLNIKGFQGKLFWY